MLALFRAPVFSEEAVVLLVTATERLSEKLTLERWSFALGFSSGRSKKGSHPISGGNPTFRAPLFFLRVSCLVGFKGRPKGTLQPFVFGP